MNAEPISTNRGSEALAPDPADEEIRDPRTMLSVAMRHFNDIASSLSVRYSELARHASMLRETLERKESEITELRGHLERTRRLASMGEMAGTVVHRLRNPLGTIAIYASLLERDLAETPDRKTMATRITEEVRRVDIILANLMLLAREPRVEPAEVAVHEMLRTVLRDCLPLVSHGRHAVEVDLGLVDDRVVVDPLLIRQVFLNVVLNALQAMPSSGSIGLRSRVEDGGVLVEISDSGEGIPSPDIDRVFDPFFTTRARGAGLGLTIAHRVVVAHGGRIELRSQGAGKGAAVSVWLPRQANAQYRSPEVGAHSGRRGAPPARPDERAPRRNIGHIPSGASEENAAGGDGSAAAGGQELPGSGTQGGSPQP